MKTVDTSELILKAKSSRFAKGSYSDWLKKAESSLKGKQVASLYRNTNETIKIKPLYTSADIPKTAGVIRNSLKKRQHWGMAQKAYGRSTAVIQRELKEMESYGQKVISFTPFPEMTKADMKELFKNMDLINRVFFMDGKGWTIPFCLLLENWVRENDAGKAAVKGFIGMDPFTELFDGFSSGKEGFLFSLWTEGVEFSKHHFPQLKTILIDLSFYESRGAHKVNQLALALSSIVEHVEYFRKRGWGTGEVLRKIVVKFPVNSDFFMEISKLRAFRYLWRHLLNAYEMGDPIPPVIFAETTLLNKSRMDPYMNLIRSSGEAFAAVIGQADYLRVIPFDEVFGEPGAEGIRHSFLTHHLFQDEAYLADVADPAGGSYFVESLTALIAERAWAAFVEMDEAGGLVQAIKSGELQNQLLQNLRKNQQQINERKKVLIGTNRYAVTDAGIKEFQRRDQWELYGKMAAQSFAQMRTKISAGAPLKDFFFQKSAIDRIDHRYSKRFEMLREKLEQMKISGTNRVKAALFIENKAIKNRKAIDFTLDFLASAGITADVYENIRLLEEIQAIVSEKEYKICGFFEGENHFQNWLHDGTLLKTFPDIRWFVAGMETKLPTGKMDDSIFIYPGADQTAVLEKMAAVLGGEFE